MPDDPTTLAPESTIDDRPLIIESTADVLAPESKIETTASNLEPPESTTPVVAPEPPVEIASPPPPEPVPPSAPLPVEPPQPSALPPQPSVEPPLPSPINSPASNIDNQSSANDVVNSLTDDQLKAAAALYAKKNQSVLSRKGVEARQATAQKNISEILSFIKSHSPASNRTIARALNLPPRRVQHYMQLLTHRGSVTATGWAASRQYYIK